MVASIMKGLTVPAYIVTGDNEITDCSSPTQGFSLWMKYFKNFGKNFCGAPLTEHQSTHPANFAFTMKGVLFIGIDLAGSPSPVAKDTVWIKQQLQAKGSQVRAAVIFAHFPPNTSTTFSTPFRRAAAAFGKPVLFLHGHGHTWSMSNPFPEPNILRVQVNKGASEDPVQVTVTMNTSSPSTAFTFKRKPWSLQTIVNMPPCADAGPDQTLASNATTITLQGSVTDDGDPQGSSLTTTWSKISGPGTVTFGNATALTTTASFNVPGTYVLRLTANDTQFQGSSDVKIIVQGATGPVLSINDVTLNEGNAGTLNAIFTVNLGFSNGSTVTVDYQIVDGTAINGEDYVIQPTSGTLTFSNWTRKHRILIPINGDKIDEQGDEKFFVNLTKATNAVFADSQGVGMIVNDDAPIPPKPPDNLLATTTGASTVDISWSDYSNNENGFNLERQTGTGAFTKIVTLGPNVNFYNDTGLTPGTVYSYRVYAFNPFGSSTYSNIYSTETTTGVVHDPNTNLALNDSTRASSTFVGFPAANVVDGETAVSYWRSGSISPDSAIWLGVDLGSVQVVGRTVIIWKADYHANSYELRVSNNNVSWKSVYKTTNGSGGNDEFLFIPVLARHVRLYMTAGLKGSYRISELELYSVELNNPPLAPKDLIATATSNSTISISWNHASNDEYGFEIERAIKGGSFRYIATVGRNASLFLSLKSIRVRQLRH